MPSGASYLRIDVGGVVELADGEALAAQLQRPEHRMGKILSVIEKGTVYTPQVRKFFPSLDKQYSALAAVTSSPIVRGAINLMVRLTPQGGRLKMFENEAEALEWLERQAIPDGDE